jgi:hypothetical protein
MNLTLYSEFWYAVHLGRLQSRSIDALPKLSAAIQLQQPALACTSLLWSAA